MGELNSLHCIFLITSTELFFTKVAPMQSVTDTALLGFSLILLPGMFVSYYTIIYFFVKYFFSNVHNSLNTVFECSYLSFGWEIGHPLSMHVTMGMEGGHQKHLQMRIGEEGYHASCARMHLHVRTYLFSCFCLMVSCFICRNWTLRSFREGVFVRNAYISPMRSISVVIK